MHGNPLEAWHRMLGNRDISALEVLLADDVTFVSPVAHTPKHGKAITTAYLSAAFHVFLNPSFRYVREIVGSHDAMLEFETEIAGVMVNGVDLLSWNAAGEITEVKVMVRPLKAVTLIHERMAASLASSQRDG